MYRCPGTTDANVLVKLANKSYGESKQCKKVPFLSPKIKAIQTDQKETQSTPCLYPDLTIDLEQRLDEIICPEKTSFQTLLKYHCPMF